MQSLPGHAQRLLQGLSCLARQRAALDCQVAGQVLNCSLSLRVVQCLTATADRFGENPKVRNLQHCNVMYSLPEYTQRLLLQGLSCLPT